MSDINKKKWFNNPTAWQKTCNEFLEFLYVERSYDDIARHVGLSKDRVRHILYQMLKEGKVRRFEGENHQSFWIRVLDKRTK